MLPATLHACAPPIGRRTASPLFPSCRQWLFILEGLATVAFGLVLRLCLAPSPARAAMLSHAEREWLVQEQDAARAAAAAARGGRRGKGMLSEWGCAAW